MYSLSQLWYFLTEPREIENSYIASSKNYIIMSLEQYELDWRNPILTFCVWVMNLDHCSFYWILKIFRDRVISLRKYSL